MPAIVTEKWSDTPLTLASLDGNWRGTRVLQVSAVASRMEALAAAANFGKRSIAVGLSHPETPRLLCTDVTCDNNPMLYTVTGNYAVTLIAFDPLQNKTQWNWRPGNESTPTDRDFYGNPLVTAAGVPFAERRPRLDGTMDLTAVRNEPFYDVAKAIRIQNTTNSDVFTVLNGGAVKIGQCRILSMTSEDWQYEGIPYARVSYNFRFKGGQLIDGTQEYDSFWDVRLNQGDSGWYNAGTDTAQSPSRGMICNSEGMPVGMVNLKANGTPMDSSLKILSCITGDVKDPIACPLPLPSTVKTITKDNAVYLCFRQFGQTAVLSLGL